MTMLKLGEELAHASISRACVEEEIVVADCKGICKEDVVSQRNYHYNDHHCDSYRYYCRDTGIAQHIAEAREHIVEYLLIIVLRE